MPPKEEYLKGRKEAFIEVLTEQHENELEGKGYDFYFSIRMKLEELINNN